MPPKKSGSSVAIAAEAPAVVEKGRKSSRASVPSKKSADASVVGGKKSERDPVVAIKAAEASVVGGQGQRRSLRAPAVSKKATAAAGEMEGGDEEDDEDDKMMINNGKTAAEEEKKDEDIIDGDAEEEAEDEVDDEADDEEKTKKKAVEKKNNPPALPKPASVLTAQPPSLQGKSRKPIASRLDPDAISSQFKMLDQNYHNALHARTRDRLLTEYNEKRLDELMSVAHPSKKHATSMYNLLQIRESLATEAITGDETQKHSWNELTAFQEQYSTEEHALVIKRRYQWYSFRGIPNDALEPHRRITSFIIAAFYEFLPIWEFYGLGERDDQAHNDDINISAHDDDLNISVPYYAMKFLYKYAFTKDDDADICSNADLSSYLSVLYVYFTLAARKDVDVPITLEIIFRLFVSLMKSKHNFHHVIVRSGEDKVSGVLPKYMSVFGNDGEAFVPKPFLSLDNVTQTTYDIVSMTTRSKDGVIESYVKRDDFIIRPRGGETRKGTTKEFPVQAISYLLIACEKNVEEDDGVVEGEDVAAAGGGGIIEEDEVAVDNDGGFVVVVELPNDGAAADGGGGGGGIEVGDVGGGEDAAVGAGVGVGGGGGEAVESVEEKVTRLAARKVARAGETAVEKAARKKKKAERNARKKAADDEAAKLAIDTKNVEEADKINREAIIAAKEAKKRPAEEDLKPPEPEQQQQPPKKSKKSKDHK
jgi:hypothetical protein